ncbi:LacI family DNA-binding transcriptional regulator [Halobacillus naozhouensis]|uniref:Substrate-binding domain-containing protein n=1 Tax=Halobacillus naozhouensis TaxID=554880 RepID=A0ABY8IY40_9BACI|nr:substrate-binding domain-containing protein [Halobacillus naozhouensis]WFT74123.1 substrate-binding domain-containing protein [Halobacillus naozhouensis]
MKTVTISDVATHAKVSKSTVSHYLNRRYDSMRENTKQRIEEAIETLGYQPNIVARSLKLKSTRSIGVIVANILHNFTTEVVRAIEDACISSDYHTIICNADDDPLKEKHYIEMLRAKQVDGLIIFPTGNNRDLYQQMLNARYPVVFLDRTVEDISIPSILLDNLQASKLAVEHFVEQGYRRIGIITTSIINHITPRIERIKGYEKAMSEQGLPIIDNYVRTSKSTDIQQAMADLLKLDEPPQAILAGNDLVLIEILKYVKQHGLRIPEDLAVIGIDDVSFASFYTPAITTIAQPTFEIGKRGAEALLKKINQKDVEDYGNFRFEPELKIRDSV